MVDDVLTCKDPRPLWGVSGMEFREGESSLLFKIVCRCRPEALEIAEESRSELVWYSQTSERDCPCSYTSREVWELMGCQLTFALRCQREVPRVTSRVITLTSQKIWRGLWRWQLACQGGDRRQRLRHTRHIIRRMRSAIWIHRHDARRLPKREHGVVRKVRCVCRTSVRLFSMSVVG